MAWRATGEPVPNTMERQVPWATNCQYSDPPTPTSVGRLSLSGRDQNTMEDQDGILNSVAFCVEQLRRNSTSSRDKESSLKELLNLLDTNEDAFSALGAHSQAVPVVVSLLRSRSMEIKILAATVLGSLCRDEDLRVKVLLGGCVPPLLGLLKSGSKEGQLAAAEAIHSLSQYGTKDNVGATIFSTEGVVPMLWERLRLGYKTVKSVDGLLTGSLRNLSAYTEGFWHATIRAGGVDILVNLLKHRNPIVQGNACFLLANMAETEGLVSPVVLRAGVVEALLNLIESGHEVIVRAGAACALKAFSAWSKEAKKEITNAKGVPRLMNATVAPSKEFIQGEYAQSLQEDAMLALANISGGLSKVISSLCDSLQSCKGESRIADQIGAIASALMIYDTNADNQKPADPSSIENVLIRELKSQLPFLVQERIVEALASLYGNKYLSRRIQNAEAKHLLVVLITMATNEVQNDLIDDLRCLCNDTDSLWHAIQGREGIQLLISLLGIASEQQQECAVALLSLLCDENDESKWAITAAGGIPPLVQLLEIGSSKAKEEAAKVLGKLCNHSEDIRACVESADAVPALLWLLKNGSHIGRAIAGRTLNDLIHKSDNSIISQLTSLLVSHLPESKVHVLEALKSLLSVAPLSEILLQGSPANDAIETMMRILTSHNETSSATSASVLAYLFDRRKDLRECNISSRCIERVCPLLNSHSEQIVIEATNCLAAIFQSIRHNRRLAKLARDSVSQLITIVNSPILEVAEQGTRAIANLLLDSEVAQRVSVNDVVLPVTRVLREGTVSGKAHAAVAIAQLLRVHQVDKSTCGTINRSGTVIALNSLLTSTGIKEDAISEVLDALVSLARVNPDADDSQPPWAVLAQTPESLGPLVSCLASGSSPIKEKAIEILSRLCQDQPVFLGNMVTATTGCISAIARKVISSNSNEVKAGGTALLICAAKEHREESMEALDEDNLCDVLIRSLVKMLESDNALKVSRQNRLYSHSHHRNSDEEIEGDCSSENCMVVMLGGRVAVWLLALIASYDKKNKLSIMEAEAIDALTNRISRTSDCSSELLKADSENESTWVCGLLLAILFQEKDVIDACATSRAIQALVALLMSVDFSNRYFAAQALASLVCNGSKVTLRAVANSGAVDGLIQLLGYAKAEISDHIAYAEAFSLVRNPEEVALERLFRDDDVRFGSLSQKVIPDLVDLLNPSHERPGALSLAVRFLTQLGIDNDSNKTKMAEVGALDALTRYLALGTQDSMEEEITHLLRILFSTPELRSQDSSVRVIDQLVAMLRLGTRVSRYNAARALEGLFAVEHNRVGETARQAIQPLVELLTSGSENEQHAAIGALIKLLFDNPSRVLDVEAGTVDVLCLILSSDCSMELKRDAAELCSVLFATSRIRNTPAAGNCVEPLLFLINSDLDSAHYSFVRAVDKLLDDQNLADVIASHDAVNLFVGLLIGENFLLHEAVISCLTKLAKDRPLCKSEIVKAGAVEKILQIFPKAPDQFFTAIAELLRVLTNDQNIAKDASAAKVVEPLFLALARPNLTTTGQHKTIQVLVNILEDPQRRASFKFTPCQAVEPLTPLLDSPSQQVQEVTAELLSLLFSEDYLQRDIIAEKAVRRLVPLIGSGVPTIQNKAIKALASVSSSFPYAVAEARGMIEVSKVVSQVDPPVPHALWESAASILSTIFQYNSQFYLEVPVPILVRMLRSGSETTVAGALNALLVRKGHDSSCDQVMAESGAIEALLELLKSHQCEEAAARLLEALVNNVKIRELKIVRAAISPLSNYLLDPQTRIQQARLLAALALGDLFQNEGLTRTADAVSACRAFVSLLEDHPTDEMKVIAICALQNLVMYSRSNKKAVAEAGGIHVILDIMSSSGPDMATQAAVFIRLLFSNSTLQEQASIETVRALSVAIERDLDTRATVNEEYLKALNALFSNFPKLRGTESATVCIPHVVAALKAGPEVIREAALDTIYLLRQGWSTCQADVAKAQAIAAAEAIPTLQQLIQSAPPKFQEKAELLLQYLPGTLLVTIKRGVNLKQSVGNPTVYCKLTLGNGPPRQTKTVSGRLNPEWDEVFAWPFDSPPKGLKLHISCKKKSTLGKGSFGKLTIQIDRVFMLGTISGEYVLQPEKNKSGQSRKLEIEFRWTDK